MPRNIFLLLCLLPVSCLTLPVLYSLHISVQSGKHGTVRPRKRICTLVEKLCRSYEQLFPAREKVTASSNVSPTCRSATGCFVLQCAALQIPKSFLSHEPSASVGCVLGLAGCFANDERILFQTFLCVSI